MIAWLTVFKLVKWNLINKKLKKSQDLRDNKMTSLSTYCLSLCPAANVVQKNFFLSFNEQESKTIALIATIAWTAMAFLRFDFERTLNSLHHLFIGNANRHDVANIINLFLLLGLASCFFAGIYSLESRKMYYLDDCMVKCIK